MFELFGKKSGWFVIDGGKTDAKPEPVGISKENQVIAQGAGEDNNGFYEQLEDASFNLGNGGL